MPSHSMAGPMHEPLLDPPPTRSASSNATASSHGNRWSPYHNAGDFSVNMAMVLLILVCTLAFFVALVAAIRFFLCHRRRSRSPPLSPGGTGTGQTTEHLEKQVEEGEGEGAALGEVFTAGMELVGAGAECAICLTELEEGEGVRVLAACHHGFHVKCIRAWLASKPSCPTCRCSYPVAVRKQPSGSESV